MLLIDLPKDLVTYVGVFINFNSIFIALKC